MHKVLYDSGEMSVGGKRYRVIVTKTDKGITVKRDSLYSDEPPYTMYFRDGNYPELPSDWQAVINDHGTTAADAWLYKHAGNKPNRITRSNP